jgi:hypothetical protein
VLREPGTNIVANSRQGQRTLARRDGTLVVTQVEEILGHRGRDPSPSMGIVQERGKGVGLAQDIQDLPECTERYERTTQVEPQIDGLLTGVTTREVLEGFQRLLEGRHRLAIRRAPERLGTGLPEIDHGFVPYLAPDSVVGQAFDLFGQTIRVLLFEPLDDAGVQQTAALLE